MPAPVLVGFDPGSADRAPVNFAIAAARFSGAPLVVGSVHADAQAIGELVHGHLEDDLLPEADESVDHLRRELAREGLRAEVRPLPGSSTPRALHEAAEQLGAGLLVVGSARRGVVGRLLPGSTADRLMHGAPCPVAVVPHGWTREHALQTLGVAYLDTPEGHEALSAAVGLARRAGAKLRVLSAAKPHGFQQTQGGGPLREPTTFAEVGSALRVGAERAVAEATAGVTDVAIEPDVSVQDPADFLIGASQTLDLLICGSRGYGPQRAVLLGGVSRRVTAGAHCPVIVLVRGAEVGFEPLLGSRADAGV